MGARKSQKGPGGTRRGQEEPGRARRSQEVPGGTRMSQEEPGRPGTTQEKKPRGSKEPMLRHWRFSSLAVVVSCRGGGRMVSFRWTKARVVGETSFPYHLI